MLEVCFSRHALHWSLTAIATTFLTGAPLHASPHPDEDGTWTPLELLSAESEAGGSILSLDADGLLVQGDVPATDVHVLTMLCPMTKVTALRIEALPHPSLPKQGPGASTNGNFVLNEVTISAGSKFAASMNQKVVLQNASASHQQNAWAVNGACDGNEHSGWAILPQAGVEHVAVFELAKPLTYQNGSKLRIRLAFNYGDKHVLGHYRISATNADTPIRAPKSEKSPGWGETQSKINAAIDKGCAWLEARQTLDGSWAGHLGPYPMGQTSLSLYTLRKSGYDLDEPSVQRASAFVRSRMPIKVYSAGCAILALDSLKNEDDLPQIERIAEWLISTQRKGWAYPAGGVDLSNTQYAALGLRAAASLGVKIGPEVWMDLADYALACQREAKGAYAPAGFSYRANGNPTGSMTAAGTAILRICSEHVSRRNSEWIRGERKGIDWLTKFFTVTTNASEDGKPNGGNLLYYLYGLERVGAFCDITHFGNHDWYREGARYLVEAQKGDGAWENSEEKTCFALLFLNRASASATGMGVAGSGGPKRYGKDDPESDLSVRASGDTPLQFWISSIGTAALEDCGWAEDEGKGLRIAEVEYLAYFGDEDVPLTLAVLPADTSMTSERQRYPGQFTFEKPGRYELVARAKVLLEGEDPADENGYIELESDPLPIQITDIVDEVVLGYAGDAARNLTTKSDITATSSSELNANHAAAKTVDNLLGLGWLSADNDPKPWIVLELNRRTRANTLVLSHMATGDKGRSVRASKVKVQLNGKGDDYEIELNPRDDRKTEWTFPKQTMLRRIRIEVVETVGGDGKKNGVGFAEIELRNER